MRLSCKNGGEHSKTTTSPPPSLPLYILDENPWNHAHKTCAHTDNVLEDGYIREDRLIDSILNEAILSTYQIGDELRGNIRYYLNFVTTLDIAEYSYLILSFVKEIIHIKLLNTHKWILRCRSFGSEVWHSTNRIASNIWKSPNCWQLGITFVFRKYPIM